MSKRYNTSMLNDIDDQDLHDLFETLERNEENTFHVNKNPISGCYPEVGKTTPCGFSKMKLYSFDELVAKGIKVSTKDHSNNAEYYDILAEFPFIILKKGTVIVHSSHNGNVLR